MLITNTRQFKKFKRVVSEADLKIEYIFCSTLNHHQGRTERMEDLSCFKAFFILIELITVT